MRIPEGIPLNLADFTPLIYGLGQTSAILPGWLYDKGVEKDVELLKGK